MTATCTICGEEFKTTQGLAGHMHFKHRDDAEATSADPVVVRGALARKNQSPLEMLVGELQLPDVVNGQAAVFDAGVQYGVRSVLIGVRVAQELSAMGVQQAVPIIKMAQEMRQSEGQAAQVIAAELAQVQMQSNRELMAALQNQHGPQPTSAPNPMQRMLGMIQTVPQMMAAAQNLMGMFGMKSLMGQQGAGAPGQPQVQNQPSTMRSGQPKMATDDDLKEAFHDE